MPLSKHFGGKGEQVMRAMRKTYGPEKAERVFYATENKMKSKMADHINTLKKHGALKSHRRKG